MLRFLIETLAVLGKLVAENVLGETIFRLVVFKGQFLNLLLQPGATLVNPLALFTLLIYWHKLRHLLVFQDGRKLVPKIVIVHQLFSRSLDDRVLEYVMNLGPVFRLVGQALVHQQLQLSTVVRWDVVELPLDNNASVPHTTGWSLTDEGVLECAHSVK